MCDCDDIGLPSIHGQEYYCTFTGATDQPFVKLYEADGAGVLIDGLYHILLDYRGDLIVITDEDFKAGFEMLVQDPVNYSLFEEVE